VKGDAQALAEFEVVRYKAIVKEKFQARIPKNRISTTTRDHKLRHERLFESVSLTLT